MGAHLKNIRGRREKKSRGGARGSIFKGMTGRVLSTLGHAGPRVRGHLFLSHLPAFRDESVVHSPVELKMTECEILRLPPALHLTQDL